MRVLLRVLAGLILVASGVLALAGGIAAWAIGSLRSSSTVDGGAAAFTATLAPVHTDGYAIVVPDISGVLARHGAGRELGDGRLTITVRSESLTPADVVVVALAPAGDAMRYLSGIAHSEVTSVGWATGDQPVESDDRPGGAPPGPPPWETAEPQPGTAPVGGRLVTVALDVPTSDPVTLVVRRWDNAAGLTADITVGFVPASWGAATAVLFLAGALGTVAGVAVLVLRRPWIDQHHRLLDLSDELPVRTPVPDEGSRPRVPPRRWRAEAEPSRHWRDEPVAGELVAAVRSPSPYVDTAT
ncbi:MAG TPA: hypothetical protein VH561_06275 [Micromonosporaceae bacterium]|jgi:hypothetical protein